jgi:hypothetical protein
MTAKKYERKSMSMKPNEYDGFFIMPGDEEGEVELRYFTFKEDFGESIDNTQVGNMYHVALFKDNETDMEFNDCFEAIFADPVVYATNLAASNLYGTFVRKTAKSNDWFDDYLKKTLDSVTLLRLSKSLEHIANT